jgi:ComF family protein
MPVLIKAFTRTVSSVVNELLPERCGICRTFGELLCSRCSAELPLPSAGPRCERCGTLSGASSCPRCEEYGSDCTSVRGCFGYAGGAKQLIAAVKYGGSHALTRSMSHLMAQQWQKLGTAVDAVVAVPLHPRRERWRGFNQAGLLARGLALELDLHFEPSLVRRRRYTMAQARVADELQRRSNVYGAFSSRRGAAAGRRVLLVDDVTTTSATLGACALALTEAGATEVHGFAFAIAE